MGRAASAKERKTPSPKKTCRVNTVKAVLRPGILTQWRGSLAFVEELLADYFPIPNPVNHQFIKFHPMARFVLGNI